jgi:hypothetical protein
MFATSQEEVGPVEPEVGIKHDEGKLRYELLPPEGVAALVHVLTIGASKYGDRNWEKGFVYSRLFGAAMRHLWAWWRGQNQDSETGLSHLAHAGTCILFLITHEERKIGKDDRPELVPSS